MLTRAKKAFIGLAALSLMATAVALTAQFFFPGVRSTSQVSVASVSTASSAVMEVAAPPADASIDAGKVLLPRPRLQSPLTSALRQTASASPPGNFPFQTVTSADHLVTLHYYSRS